MSFNDKRGGGISKQGRGGPRGGDRNRPKFNIRADAIIGRSIQTSNFYIKESLSKNFNYT